MCRVGSMGGVQRAGAFIPSEVLGISSEWLPDRGKEESNALISGFVRPCKRGRFKCLRGAEKEEIQERLEKRGRSTWSILKSTLYGRAWIILSGGWVQLS